MTDIYLPPAFYYPKALTNGARVLPPPPLRPAPANARQRFPSGSERPSTATSDRLGPSDRHDQNTNEAGPPSARPNTSSMRQNTLSFLYGYHTLPATLPITQSHPFSGPTSALQSPVTPEPNAFDRDMKLLKKKGQTIDLIDKAGRKLGFPSLTIFAAKVYYHRFATLTGLQNTRTFDVATACLFTASKSEETVKKLHYILNAMHAILDPTKPEIDPESQAMEEERRRILTLEMRILEAIRFDFRIANAYTFARKMAHQLKMDRLVASRAQELITDSLRSTLCVQYPPHVIAAGTLMLASVMCGQPFDPTVQTSSGDATPWDQYYKFREEDAEDVAHQILDLYIQVDERSKESALVDWKIHFQQITFTKNKERHAAREVIRQRELAIEMERQRLQAEAEAREQREAEERMRRHRQLEALKQQQQQKQQELLAKQQQGRRHHMYPTITMPHEDGSRKRKPGDQDVHMMDEEEERRLRAEEEQWRAEEKARLLRHTNPPKHDRPRSNHHDRSHHDRSNQHHDRSSHHNDRSNQHHDRSHQQSDRSSKSTPHRGARPRQGQSTPSASANHVPLGTIYPDETKRPSRGDERYDYRADEVRPYDPYSRHRSPPGGKRRDRYVPAPAEEQQAYHHRDRSRPLNGDRRKSDHYSRGQPPSSSPYDYGRRRDRPRSPSPPPSHARADRSRQRGHRRPEAAEEEEEDFVSRRQKSRY